jgi:hypothetical protein
MDLPRIPRTPISNTPYSPAARFADASVFIKNLLTGMPERVEQDGLFKISLLPPRLMTIREVQRFRMAELSVQAQRCFQAKHGIAGAVLLRAAFETSAVLFYVDNAVRKAVAGNALDEVGDLLLKVVVGSKVVRKSSEDVPNIEAVNVLTMVKHLDRMYSGFAAEYDYLCEVAHPNQMGALIPYGELGKNFDVLLAPKPTFGDQFCSTFCMALMVFEHHYNRIADVFPAFVELCRRDGPRTSNG